MGRQAGKLSRGMDIMWWAVVFLWMVLIFCLSAQTASDSAALSGKIIRKVLEFLSPDFLNLLQADQARVIANLQHLVRKTAHVLMYMVLGVLSMDAFYRHNMTRRVIYTILLCVCYAVTDELHQLFVAGRGAQITDVAIDSGGVLLGIGLILLVKRI